MCCFSADLTRSITSLQSPYLFWRNMRILGYQKVVLPDIPHLQSGTLWRSSHVVLPRPAARCATEVSLVMMRLQFLIIAAVSRKSQTSSIRSWHRTKRSLKLQVSSCSLPLPFCSERKDTSLTSESLEISYKGDVRPLSAVFSARGFPCQLIPIIGLFSWERMFLHFAVISFSVDI